MKLHNRIIKASFWTDTELLSEFDHSGRLLYLGLIQLADDSGCLEYNIAAFKGYLFPIDAAMTTRKIEKYTSKLIEMTKLIRYESHGKSCVFLKNFHKHQALRHPDRPDVPLPFWISWVSDNTPHRSGSYSIQQIEGVCTDVLQSAELQTVRLSGSYSGSGSNSKEGGLGETIGSEKARACFTVLQATDGYQFNTEVDGKFITDLIERFTEVDVEAELWHWSTWRSGQPRRKGERPRAQIITWMKKAVEFKQRDADAGGSNGKSAPIKRNRTADEQDYCLKHGHYPDDPQQEIAKCKLCRKA